MSAAAAERLRRVADALKAGEPVAPDDADELAAAIDAWLNKNAVTLDAALGLRQHGGISAVRAADLQWRDQELRRLRQRFWADMPVAAAARLMIQSASRYETTRWARDCDAMTAPGVEPQATWWQLLQAGVPVPGSRRLRDILADGNSRAL